MKKPNRVWLALAAAVAMLGVVSCGDDDVFNAPIEEAVEAGLDGALNDTVVPLVDFYSALGDALTTFSVAAPLGVCPSTTGWCEAGGSVSCTGTTSATFTFVGCVGLSGDTSLILDGDVTVSSTTPGVYTLGFGGLSINGSSAATGSGSITVSSCNYTVGVTAGSSTVSGSVTSCAGPPDYPTAGALDITFDDFTIAITFDGTKDAHAVAMRGGSTVANCTIDMLVTPLASSCDAS